MSHHRLGIQLLLLRERQFEEPLRSLKNLPLQPLVEPVVHELEEPGREARFADARDDIFGFGAGRVGEVGREVDCGNVEWTGSRGGGGGRRRGGGSSRHCR